MKVRFKTSTVLVNGLSYASNQVVDVEDALVSPLIEAGIAEQVSEATPIGTKIVGDIPENWKNAPAEEGKPGKKPTKPKKSVE